MIIASIDQDVGFPEIVQSAILYLKQTNYTQLGIGKHAIDRDCTIVVDEYSTKPKEGKKAEQHRDYIDMQFMLEGTERIFFGFPDLRNKLAESYVPEKERAIFSSVENEQSLILVPGIVAIFFPGEIHRPGCIVERAENVRKGVIKIPKSASHS